MKTNFFLPLVITIFLAIIPFFWLKPGWMDLGGDSSRLYFYDPINYLKSFPLYGVTPDGFGDQNIAYYLIPFVSFLYILKVVFQSPYLVITLFNSLQLVIAFLSIYFICLEFFKGDNQKAEQNVNACLTGIVAGLFYALSPFLSPNGWDKAMFVHNQYFLNPLLFFLLLRYIHARRVLYLVIALLVTFVFAPNFSPSPSVFAFYPFILLYLLIYSLWIRRTSLALRTLFMAAALFLTIHSFHLVPFINNFFSGNSVFHQIAFSEEGKVSRGLDYFIAVAKTTSLTNNLISLPQGESPVIKIFEFLWFIFPTVIVLGLLLQKKDSKQNSLRNFNFILLIVFFLITLFFVTGVITEAGLNLYKSFFRIPGFSMFRNYVGQFSYVFIFFYTLVVGQSIFSIFSSINIKQRYFLFSFLIGVVVISSWSFVKGDMINLVINKGSKIEIRVPIKMDPEFEQTLLFIRNSKIDGKYLTLPFTEAGLQMVGGIEGGAYQGPSVIPYLTGKKDFSGYQVMHALFSEQFLRMVRNRDYHGINSLLSILNIKYIFYNSDPYIYNDNFPGLPYSYINVFMPADQYFYKEFIEHLAVKKKIDFGQKYHIYELDPSYYIPHIYVAKKIVSFDKATEDATMPLTLKSDDRRIAIVGKNISDQSIINESVFGEKKINERLKSPQLMNNIIPIASSVPRELYANIYPFMILPFKFPFTSYTYRDNLYIQKELNIIEKKLYVNHDSKDEWEKALGEYENAMKKLIDNSKKQNNQEYLPAMNDLVLKDVVNLHNLWIEKKINDNREIKNEDKNGLLKLSNAISASIYNSFDLERLDSFQAQYVFEEISPGEYEVLVEKHSIPKNDQQGLNLIFNNNKLSLASNQSEEKWISFGNVQKDSHGPDTSLLSLPVYVPAIEKPLLDLVTKNLLSEGSIRILISEGMLSHTQGIVQKFADWDENTQYLISFNYLTNANLWQNNSDWRKFKAFVDLGQKIKPALFQVLEYGDSETKKIIDPGQVQQYDIKNFSLTKISSPNILLRKVSSTKKNNTIPKITFTKINPTKYKIEVVGAKDPYTLVFLDGFSRSWKLFLEDKEQDSTAPDSDKVSYFGGEINEKFSGNIFLDNNLFDTLGKRPIAENNHFEVNGYANAWHIKPQDTQSKTDYSLILEMTVQRTFYVFFLISIIGVVICLIWLGMVLSSNKEKNHEPAVD